MFKRVQGHKLSLSHAHVMPSSLAIVSQSLIIARIQEKLRVDETGKESRRGERGTEREGVLVMLITRKGGHDAEFSSRVCSASQSVGNTVQQL